MQTGGGTSSEGLCVCAVDVTRTRCYVTVCLLVYLFVFFLDLRWFRRDVPWVRDSGTGRKKE